MRKLAEICVRRPVFATMLIMALVAPPGTLSYFSLSVGCFPTTDFTNIRITVVNRGASAEEIETEITEKVESAVSPISGIDELRSTSVDGASQVLISFGLDKSPDAAAAETRSRIESIRGDLPDTSEAPVISEFEKGSNPTLRLVVSGPSNLREVTEMADLRIRKHLEGVSGVGDVSLFSGSRREIQIDVDPNRLRAYNLTVSDAAAAIHAQNIVLPSGLIHEGPLESTVRTLRIMDPAQFNEIVIAARGGFPIRVRDIGKVSDSSTMMRSASHFNGSPAVTLNISKQPGRNTVTVAGAVESRLAEIAETLPRGYRAEILGDQSIFSRSVVRSLWKRMIAGALLAAVVVYLFLRSVRSTMIAAIAIPATIISSFALMAAMSYTFNQITMLALITVVGIAIGDAIVVVERIHNYIESRAMRPHRAAIEATREVLPVALATTLSLLALFLPMGLIEISGAGRFLSSFGLIASFAAVVSLLIAFTVIPMLSARLIGNGMPGLRDGDPEVRDGESLAADRVIDRPLSAPRSPARLALHDHHIDRFYNRLVEWSMSHRRLIIAISVLAIISAIPLFRFIGKNFLPEEDQSQFEISISAPEGHSLNATMTALDSIADRVRRLPGVTDTLTMVGEGARDTGEGARDTGEGARDTSKNGSIYVRLSAIEDRGLAQSEIMGRAREMLSHFPKELSPRIEEFASGALEKEADLRLVISGPDLTRLNAYSEELVKRLSKIPHVVNADRSIVAGRPELRVVIDRQRAADLGARIGDIAQTFNTLGAGQPVTSFIASGGESSNEKAIDGGAGRECGVVLRAIGGYLNSDEGNRKLSVPSSHGGMIDLDQIVSIENGAGPGSIDRLNRQRQATLTADVEDGGSQSEVISRVNKIIDNMKLAPGYTPAFAGRSKDLGLAGDYFALAITLSFIFIYIILAACFESIRLPATTLLTLALAIPFGLISLLVLGQTIDIISGLGLLFIFSALTRNSILLIDGAKRLRATGLAPAEAIIRASRARLRPILMTTIAPMAALAPLLITNGPGGGTNRSICAIAIGAQLFLIPLTLLVAPVLYASIEDLAESRTLRNSGARLNRIESELRERINRFRELRGRTRRD